MIQKGQIYVSRYVPSMFAVIVNPSCTVLHWQWGDTRGCTFTRLGIFNDRVVRDDRSISSTVEIFSKDYDLVTDPDLLKILRLSLL